MYFTNFEEKNQKCAADARTHTIWASHIKSSNIEPPKLQSWKTKSQNYKPKFNLFMITDYKYLLLLKILSFIILNYDYLIFNIQYRNIGWFKYTYYLGVI